MLCGSYWNCDMGAQTEVWENVLMGRRPDYVNGYARYMVLYDCDMVVGQNPCSRTKVLSTLRKPLRRLAQAPQVTLAHAPQVTLAPETLRRTPLCA